MNKQTDKGMELDEILAPIHDNGQDGLSHCDFQDGRWPKPHTCGLVEAKSEIEAHTQAAVLRGQIEALKALRKYTHTGRGTILWEMDELLVRLNDRIKQLQSELKALEDG